MVREPVKRVLLNVDILDLLLLDDVLLLEHLDGVFTQRLAVGGKVDVAVGALPQYLAEGKVSDPFLNGLYDGSPFGIDLSSQADCRASVFPLLTAGE